MWIPRIAITHKLARGLWHLFNYRETFNPEVFQQEAQKLHNTAAALGLTLVPAQRPLPSA